MLCSAGQLHEVENMRLWYPRCTLGISPKRIPFISEVRVAYCGETANSENQKITVKCWKSTWHIQFVCYCTDKVLIQALTNLGHKENRFAGWHPICSVFVFVFFKPQSCYLFSVTHKCVQRVLLKSDKMFMCAPVELWNNVLCFLNSTTNRVKSVNHRCFQVSEVLQTGRRGGRHKWCCSLRPLERLACKEQKFKSVSEVKWNQFDCFFRLLAYLMHWPKAYSYSTQNTDLHSVKGWATKQWL